MSLCGFSKISLETLVVQYNVPEVVGVTFSNSDSSPVPKFLNPGPAILQI